MLHDAHIHLNACANADELAEYAANQGIYVACVTRNAEEFHTARACFARYSGIDVGLGLHPWDITSKAAAEKLLAHFQSMIHIPRSRAFLQATFRAIPVPLVSQLLVRTLRASVLQHVNWRNAIYRSSASMPTILRITQPAIICPMIGGM